MADRSRDFFTETASMPTLTFPSSSQVDWGFRIGLGLVALFAAVELGSVGYYYAGRARAARVSSRPAVAVTAPTPAPAAPTVAPSTAPVTAPSVAATSPPAVAAAPPATPALPPAERLLQEATALRARGDTTNALARLQEATQRDPKNAAVLAEMASTYESMQLYDRSNETWRKIEEIGPSAGSWYDVAESKLKLGASAPAAATAPPTTASAAPAVANVAPAVTPPAMPSAPAEQTSVATSRPSAEGAAGGQILSIGDVAVTEEPDYSADTNLTVRIPIKARPGAIIDHTKVTIRVYFYDTEGDDPKPKLTDAQTNFEWLTPNHDWAGPNPEVLAVNYFRPKTSTVSSEAALSAAAANVVPGKKGRPASTKLAGSGAGARHYLGYIVRIYYNDKLQAERGQPSQLLTIFPAPSASP